MRLDHLLSKEHMALATPSVRGELLMGGTMIMVPRMVAAGAGVRICECALSFLLGWGGVRGWGKGCVVVGVCG